MGGRGGGRGLFTPSKFEWGGGLGSFSAVLLVLSLIMSAAHFSKQRLVIGAFDRESCLFIYLID